MLLQPTDEGAKKFLEREEFARENEETSNSLLQGSQSVSVSVLGFLTTLYQIEVVRQEIKRLLS